MTTKSFLLVKRTDVLADHLMDVLQNKSTTIVENDKEVLRCFYNQIDSNKTQASVRGLRGGTHTLLFCAFNTS